MNQAFILKYKFSNIFMEFYNIIFNFLDEVAKHEIKLNLGNETIVVRGFLVKGGASIIYNLSRINDILVKYHINIADLIVTADWDVSTIIFPFKYYLNKFYPQYNLHADAIYNYNKQVIKKLYEDLVHQRSIESGFRIMGPQMQNEYIQSSPNLIPLMISYISPYDAFKVPIMDSIVDLTLPTVHYNPSSIFYVTVHDIYDDFLPTSCSIQF